MIAKTSDSTSTATCAKCGESFACGAATGKCWCMELPRVHAVPVDAEIAGCYCPKCLASRTQDQTVSIGDGGRESGAI